MPTQYIEIASRYGASGIIILALGFTIVKLWLHIKNETIPMKVYDKQDKLDDLTKAVESNTSTLEKIALIFEERIPRKSS